MDTSISLPPDPKSIAEALAGPDREEWIKSIEKEMQVFRDRRIFGKASQNGRAMKSKMILRYMFKNDFTIKYKARLVACGYSQIHGLDYHDTYAPTVNNVVVFIILQLIASRRLFAGSVDVSAAFLEGEQENKLFAWLPAELCEDNIPVRVEVLRNWYGTKQASKVWYDKLNDILVDKMGFKRCPCMFGFGRIGRLAHSKHTKTLNDLCAGYHQTPEVNNVDHLISDEKRLIVLNVNSL
jgi:hypothetical protein